MLTFVLMGSLAVVKRKRCSTLGVRPQETVEWALGPHRSRLPWEASRTQGPPKETARAATLGVRPQETVEWVLSHRPRLPWEASRPQESTKEAARAARECLGHPRLVQMRHTAAEDPPTLRGAQEPGGRPLGPHRSLSPSEIPWSQRMANGAAPATREPRGYLELTRGQFIAAAAPPMEGRRL